MHGRLQCFCHKGEYCINFPYNQGSIRNTKHTIRWSCGYTLSGENTFVGLCVCLLHFVCLYVASVCFIISSARSSLRHGASLKIQQHTHFKLSLSPTPEFYDSYSKLLQLRATKSNSCSAWRFLFCSFVPR